MTNRRQTPVTTRRERRLEKAGYYFSGFYTSESKDIAKQKAQEYRDAGYYATVVTKTYQGRVYNTEGYSVFIKPKQEGMTKHPYI